MSDPPPANNGEWALRYTADGLPVFPCHFIRDGGRCSCGKADCDSPGKHPITRNGCLDASTDAETVRQWWRVNPQANIGCATGTASGLWVLDVEAEGLADLQELEANEGDRLSTNPATVTGGGGQHHLFKLNGHAVNNMTRVNGKAIDVRGAGGYIILPPSNHASGERYAWMRPLEVFELEEAPAWVVEFVTTGRSMPTSTATSTPATGKGFTCVASGFDDAPPARQGTRHAELVSLVGREFARGLQVDAVLQAALQWAATCDPPHDANDVRRVVQDIAGREFSRLQAEKSGGTAAGTAADLQFLSAGEFSETDYRMRFLVKRVMVAGQPAIVGGPKKCLKTSILCDLALSLGFGKPFLGHFDVPERVNVGILSGESGGFTLKETANRICLSKGRMLSQSSTWWGFDLPQLSQATDLQRLVDAIQRHAFDVTIIDPAYLCLLDGGMAESAGNVFRMGSILRTFAQVGVETGTTLVLAHHSTKAAGRQHEPLELEDLSQSGFAEFARQWLLLSRRDAYEYGTGRHELWLSVGGSAGHSGLYGVNVDEGVLQDDFTGRTWEVDVVPASRLFVDEAAAKAEQKRVEAETVLQSRRQDILDAMRKFPDGETQRGIRELTSLNPSNFGKAFATLVADKTAVPCTITKANGREYDGFKLVTGTTGTGHRDTGVPLPEAHSGTRDPLGGPCPSVCASGEGTGQPESVPVDETWEF